MHILCNRTGGIYIIYVMHSGAHNEKHIEMEQGTGNILPPQLHAMCWWTSSMQTHSHLRKTVMISLILRGQ